MMCYLCGRKRKTSPKRVAIEDIQFDETVELCVQCTEMVEKILSNDSKEI